MSAVRPSIAFKIWLVSIFLSACQAPDLAKLTAGPINFVKNSKASDLIGVKKDASENRKLIPLPRIIDSTKVSIDIGSGFAASIKQAVEKDPAIIADRQSLLAKGSYVSVVESRKDFQVSGTVYAGVEDVTDETAGVALSVSANRLIYDGGGLDAQISFERLSLESEQHAFEARLNQRSMELASIWVDLLMYQDLNSKIESRLVVLNPLIEQLEQVAKAGAGDVTRVAAAQRTVSTIRVTQTEVSEELAQARLNFVNSFGALPDDRVDISGLIEKSVPQSLSDELAQDAPAIKSSYASYKAAEARLLAVQAKDSFNVGFETRVQRPFGESQYDSDEKVGLVIRKTIFDGKGIDSEVEQAQSEVVVSEARLRAMYREGERLVKTAKQNIQSMNKAILLARESADVTAEEIAYLKRQLIIGGSTIDAVLAAEARLYDAEAKAIRFLAEKQKSELMVLSSLGILSELLGFKS